MELTYKHRHEGSLQAQDVAFQQFVAARHGILILEFVLVIPSVNVAVFRRCHGQADHVKKYHYLLIVTKNTKKLPSGGQPPSGLWAYRYDPLTALYIQRLPNHA
jgi:hypothetical protein